MLERWCWSSHDGARLSGGGEWIPRLCLHAQLFLSLLEFLYPSPGVFSLHPSQGETWMSPHESSSLFNHPWWNWSGNSLSASPAQGSTSQIPNPKCDGTEKETAEGAEPQEGALSSRGVSGAGMSWWEGRGVCFRSFGNVQLLQGKLGLSRSLQHSLRASLPGREGRALWKPSREPGELPEPCLIQDCIQDNVPGHLMLSRSQVLLLHPENPQFPGRAVT